MKLRASYASLSWKEKADWMASALWVIVQWIPINPSNIFRVAIGLDIPYSVINCAYRAEMDKAAPCLLKLLHDLLMKGFSQLGDDGFVSMLFLVMKDMNFEKQYVNRLELFQLTDPFLPPGTVLTPPEGEMTEAETVAKVCLEMATHLNSHIAIDIAALKMFNLPTNNVDIIGSEDDQQTVRLFNIFMAAYNAYDSMDFFEMFKKFAEECSIKDALKKCVVDLQTKSFHALYFVI